MGSEGPDGPGPAAMAGVLQEARVGRAGVYGREDLWGVGAEQGESLTDRSRTSSPGKAHIVVQIDPRVQAQESELARRPGLQCP